MLSHDHPPGSSRPVNLPSDFPTLACKRRKAESRRATHDGYIWPFARNLMGISECIRERMAEDLAHLIREAGAFETVCDDALIALGWTPEQVRRYGEQAARQVRGENACGNDNALCDEVA